MTLNKPVAKAPKTLAASPIPNAKAPAKQTPATTPAGILIVFSLKIFPRLNSATLTRSGLEILSFK